MRKIIHQVTDTAQTVGAVAVTVASFDLASAGVSPDGLASDNCAVDVETLLLGRTSAGDMARRRFTRGAKRQAGALAALGAVTDLVVLAADAALALVGSDLDVSGDAVRCRATGVAGQTVDWFARMTITIWQP